MSLDESTLRQFGVSFGFQVTLMSITENLVCDTVILLYLHDHVPYMSYVQKRSLQSNDRETLSQPPTGSAATSTTQHQPSSATSIKIGKQSPTHACITCTCPCTQ